VGFIGDLAHRLGNLSSGLFQLLLHFFAGLSLFRLGPFFSFGPLSLCDLLHSIWLIVQTQSRIFGCCWFPGRISRCCQLAFLMPTP
jgi:hypothetical protein